MTIVMFTVLSAVELKVKEGNTITTNDNLVVEFKGMKGQHKDWIAVYKGGSSNAWENVVKWKYTDDKLNGEINFGKLPVGMYDVRAFYNNSFKEEEAYNHLVVGQKGDLGFKNLYASYTKHNRSLTISVGPVNIFGSIHPNPTDWIGVYKKGSSNAWGNVIKWLWAKDLKNPEMGEWSYSFRNTHLNAGEYEVRYFLNNTFKTHLSKTFTVHPKVSKFNLGKITIFDNYTGLISVDLHPKKVGNINPNPKDWVAIYKKGSSNAWQNVVKWAWVKDFNMTPDEGEGSRRYFFRIKPDKNVAYELRYFLNNSFTTYKSVAIEK